MKNFTFLVTSLFFVVNGFAQTPLVKVDADEVAPTSGCAYPSVFSENNSMAKLCVSSESNYFEPNTGSNRTVSSSTLEGKSGKLIRSQYLSSGSSFWLFGPISTVGFSNIFVSAWHRGVVSGSSSNNVTAKNWSFEYCVGDVVANNELAWNVISEYSINNDSWTETATVLPNDCNDQQSIFIRWKSVGDKVSTVDGVDSNQNAWTWIDEIVVNGSQSLEVDAVTTDACVSVNGHMLIIAATDAVYDVFTINGVSVAKGKVDGSATLTLTAGIYFVKVKGSGASKIKKVIVK